MEPSANSTICVGAFPSGMARGLAWISEPRIAGTAADTEEEANRIHEQMVRQHVTAMHFNGRVVSEGEITHLMSSPAGQQYASMLNYYGVGTGEQVADYLQIFTEKAQADELMLLIKGPTTQSNGRSMELIAQAWGLDRRTQPATRPPGGANSHRYRSILATTGRTDCAGRADST